MASYGGAGGGGGGGGGNNGFNYHHHQQAKGVFNTHAGRPSVADTIGEYTSEQFDKIDREEDGGKFGKVMTILARCIPFAIAGAAAGIATKTLHILASDEKKKKVLKFKDFPSMSHDGPLIEMLEIVEPFAVICPEWMGVVKGHLDFICEAWTKFNSMTWQIKSIHRDLEDEISETRNVKTVEDAAKYIFSILIPPQYRTAASERLKGGGNGSKQQHSGEYYDYARQEKERSEREAQEVSAAFEKLKTYFDESTVLISAIFKSRVCLSGLFVKLHEMVTLYNIFLSQVGPTILCDPSSITLQTSTSESQIRRMIQDKITLAENLLTHGWLPTKSPSVTENDHTASCIKYWIAVLVMFVPTMKWVAQHFGWRSEYNGNEKDGPTHVDYGGIGTMPTNIDAETKKRVRSSGSPGFYFSDASKKFSFGGSGGGGGGDGDGSDGGGATGSSGGNKSERPTTEHSLKDQGKFWLKRAAAEGGIAGIIKNPWAGFQPAVGDDGKLPTVMMDRSLLVTTLKSIMARFDEKVQGMMDAQRDLLGHATRMGDLRTYYVNKVRSGGDDILELHMKWQQWHPATATTRTSSSYD